MTQENKNLTNEELIIVKLEDGRYTVVGETSQIFDTKEKAEEWKNSVNKALKSNLSKF